MSRIIDFSIGKFDLIYENYHESASREKWRRQTPPLIEPFVIPRSALTPQVFVTDIYNPDTSPSWMKAGQLVQYIESPYVPGNAFAGEGMPICSSYTPLNRRKLHILEDCRHPFRLAFEPVPWLPKFNIRIWEWLGSLRDEVIEQLNAIEFDLEILKDESPP